MPCPSAHFPSSLFTLLPLPLLFPIIIHVRTKSISPAFTGEAAGAAAAHIFPSPSLGWGLRGSRGGSMWDGLNPAPPVWPFPPSCLVALPPIVKERGLLNYRV